MFFGISILRAGFEPRPIAWQRRKSPANRTLYFIGMRWVKTTPKARLKTGADELKPEKTPWARRVFRPTYRALRDRRTSSPNAEPQTPIRQTLIRQAPFTLHPFDGTLPALWKSIFRPSNSKS